MSAALETRTTRLALAVRLRDDLTEADAIGPLEVSIGGRPAPRNRSGYFLFFRLPAGAAHVAVAPAYYLPEELTATIPAPDPLAPVVEGTLLPGALYPFPDGTTLVRGRVTDPAGEAIAEASVQGVGRPTRTDEDGHFTAYFRALSEDDIAVVAHRRLVKAPDGTTQFDLAVSHPLFHPRTIGLSDLEEGVERRLDPVVLTPM